MNKTMLASLLAALAFASAAHAEAVAGSGYVRDARGVIVKSGHGLCWRTGYWTPAMAEAECDPDLVKRAAVAPEQQLKPATEMARPVCEFGYTLGNGETFAFDTATLTPAAKSAIDREVIARLRACDERTPLRVTGHTDYLGSQSYNQKLSVRRAEAVANHLAANGVAAARIELKAAGEGAPLKDCASKQQRKPLLACLAPNRRTVIEVGRFAN